MNPLRKINVFVLIFIMALFYQNKVNAQTTTLFNDWVTNESNGTATLPTFSYAGYHYGDEGLPTVDTANGYVEFNVKNAPYNAQGDGVTDDKAAIQAAITAAEAYIGTSNTLKAIIKFPPGVFLVNTTTNNTDLIKITKSNIVIKGSGSGPGGTELIHQQYLTSTTGADYNCPYLFQFKADNFWYSSQTKITDVTGTAAMNSFEVTVTDTSSSELQVGEWISLRTVNNLDLVTDEFSPLSVNDVYGGANLAIKNNGANSIEYHKIKNINPNTKVITFEEPILKPVSGSGWGIYKFNEIEEVGVQDLKYTGGFTDKHLHHKASAKMLTDRGLAITDANRNAYAYLGTSGWSGIEFNGVVNGWIKNVEFSQMSQCVLFKNSAHITAINNKYTGNYPGHNFITAASSTKCLIGLNNDNATGDNIPIAPEDEGSYHFRNNGKGVWHGCGVSKESIGNVVWRTNHPTDGHTGAEMHASQPRANLFDKYTGGILLHMGGAETQVPNHLKKLVIWNFDGVSNDAGKYETGAIDFWQPGIKWKTTVVKPIIVGLTGGISLAQTSDCEVAESLSSHVSTATVNGQPVNIESLYEAQLVHRKGSLPVWVNEAKNFNPTPTTDTQAPTTPTNFVASNITETTADLSWIASTDNVAVTGYNIYNGTTLLSTVTSLAYSATGLTADTAYTFNVEAIDAAGNISTQASVNVSTIATPDTQAPTVPTNLTTSNITQTAVDLNWTASTDDTAVTGYNIYNGTTLLSTVTNLAYSVTGLTADTAYTFNVEAIDAAGNISTQATVNVSTLQIPDTQAPTAPTNLVANNITQTAVDLNWTASTDDTAVTGYNVYNGTTLLSTVTSLAYSVTGLTADTAYTFNVEAIDAAGNKSTQATVNVSTLQTPDTQAPTVPTNLTTSNITQTAVDLNWTAATDDTAVTGYNVYNGTTLLSTVTSLTYSVTGLTADTAYIFNVEAIDAANNTSTQATVNVSTLTATNGTSYTETFENSPADDSWGGSINGDNNVIWSLTSGVKKTSAVYLSSGKCLYMQGLNKGDTKITSSTISGGISSISLQCLDKWSPGNTRNIEIWIGNQLVLAQSHTGTEIYTPTVSGLTISGDFTITIKNTSESSTSNTIAFDNIIWTSYAASVDTQAPTVPTNFSASNIAETTVDLNWTAATDNVAVTGYNVYNGTTLLTTTTNTSYNVTNLTADTAYTFNVEAIDAAGNKSTQATINATTNPIVTISNIALFQITHTTAAQNGRGGENAVDNNDADSSRWSVQNYTQSLIVDLGSVKTITGTELVCYKGRAYQFNVSTSNTLNGTYTQIIDRSGNTTAGTQASPITDNLANSVNAQFVKLTVTGASGYSGSWISINEFRVMGYDSAPAPIANSNDLILKTETINQPAVSPNPFANKLTVNVSEANTQVYLVNMNGKIVDSKLTNGNSVELNPSYNTVPPGVYFVKTINSKETKSFKVIRK